MRKWQGRRDDLSDTADEGLKTAQNVSFKTDGELRRRPGLADKLDWSGTLVTEWSDPFGTPYLVYADNHWANPLEIDTYNLNTKTVYTVTNALNATNRGCFARSNGRLYFTNDFDAMRRISDGRQPIETAGINAPTGAIGTPSTATGLCTAGTHGMRYRYFDSKSLYMSDPSDQTDITLTGGSALTFSIFTSGSTIIRSTDPKVDQIIIELTDAGSHQFYRAATVNQTLTGTTVSISDTSLRLQVSASRDGDFNHQPPPLCSYIVEHRARLFGFGAAIGTIFGTVATSGSTNISSTGVAMSTGWAGRLVRVGTDDKTYRIAAMSGTSTMVLSEAYTGTTASSYIRVFSSAPDMLYWSRAGFPESWNSLNQARRVLQNTPDTPSGLVSHHEVLYLFGQRTMRMMDYSSDPAGAQLIQIPTEMGLWNQRCLVECNGRIYGWGRSGVFTINGLIPEPLSRPIDAHIDGSDPSSVDNFDVSKFEKFFGLYDPRERCILWLYCTSADTDPKHAIVFDIDNQQWSITTFKNPMLSGTLVTGGTTDPTRALLGDGLLGFSWRLTPDTFDGVPAVLSGGVLTVSNTGSTTTVINVSESLPTGSIFTDLEGVVAVYSSQESAITANTANTITVSPAFTSEPTLGSEIYLGPISFSVRTKWTVIDGFQNKKRPQYLMIALVPGTSSGKLTVKIYLDYSSSPFVYTKGSSDSSMDGITITNNSASVQVDLDGGSGDGVAFVPLPALWHRSIAVDISSDRPQNLLKVLDFQWLFKNPRSTYPVEDE